MSRRAGIALLLSLALHVGGLVFILVVLSPDLHLPAGALQQGVFAMWGEFSGADSAGSRLDVHKVVGQTPQGSSEHRVKDDKKRRDGGRLSSSNGDGTNEDGGRSGGRGGSATGDGGHAVGSNGAGGESLVLTQIRSKIEQHKRYPQLAERQGLQGRVVIEFRIDELGQPQDIAVLSSSGVALLDQESIATVRRAAPFPIYHEAVTVPLIFVLHSH